MSRARRSPSRLHDRFGSTAEERPRAYKLGMGGDGVFFLIEFGTEHQNPAGEPRRRSYVGLSPNNGPLDANARFSASGVRFLSVSRKGAVGVSGPPLFRVVGCLPHKNVGASSGGRRPTSLRGGNRGPVTRGGAAFYGESAFDRCCRIERLASTRR
jgi:hypothetical protein